MTGRVVLAIAGLLALSGCGFRQGRCSTEDSEALRNSMLVALLQRDFMEISADAGEARRRAAAYLAAYPECCRARGVGISLWDAVRWDRSSQPRYHLTTAFAYREGPTISIYRRQARGDACGHVFDELRMGEHAAGPYSDPCEFTEEARAEARRKGVPLACAQTGPRAITPFPAGEALRLQRENFERQMEELRRQRELRQGR